jgi:molybdate transport system substrate-binding protein
LRRVQQGEPFDLVVLASNAIDRLLSSGHAVAGSRVDIALSSVAVAIKAGAARPDISSAEAVRAAVLAAPSIGYSTGPSGTALHALLKRWGIDEEVRSRLIQASPGVPVASLIARGEVVLGFQQLSELQGVQGVEVLGLLPQQCAIRTIFSGAICAASMRPAAARKLLEYLASPQTAETKKSHGMAGV